MNEKIAALNVSYAKIFFTRLFTVISLCLLVFNVVGANGQNRPFAAIPFETTGNLIFLKTRVNKSEPLWFILDTGASVNIVKQKRAQDLSLKLESKQDVFDGLPYTKGVSLNLPGAELADQTVFAAPIESLEPSVGRTIDGIIGADIFNRFVVEIDYAAERINLYQPESYSYKGAGEIIPVTIEDDTPFVNVRLTQPESNSAEGKFLVDTGASAALNVFRRFDDPHKFSGSLVKTLENTGIGFSNRSPIRTGRIKKFQLGRFVVENPVASFSQAADSSDETGDGEIGGEFLRRFKVVIDYSRKRIILEPNARFAEPFEASFTGASLAAGGADFKTFKVKSVLDGSPAAEAGLRAGDVITAVDGKPAARFTAEQLRRMFRQESRKYILNIKRGETVLQATLKTRRLI